MATVARRIVTAVPSVGASAARTVREYVKEPVAAYARVSTEKEEQEDSFERQVEHYTKMIQTNPKWSFVEVYADPGITGTKADKRPNFMRMIDDCRAGKIKKVLVKSVSRFARNTVDALTYIRELKDLGVSVYFESENIDTMTPGGDVLLTILAAMAEQESRTISANIKWAYQKKFEKGEVTINTGLMLGYEKAGKTEDGRTQYRIIEEEAAIVRRIYREYIGGKTITQISQGLREDGLVSKRGCSTWCSNTITNILKNEKYAGNAVLGKTYKPDVLSKKCFKNDGSKSPMYYAENTHPAIIDEETFELAKEEMERRQNDKQKAAGRSRYSSKYPFSGILLCGNCGSRLRRHLRKVGSGKRVPAWGCANRIINGRAVCDSHHVNEDVLQRTYLAALQTMVDGSEEIIEAIEKSAATEMRTDTDIDNIEQKIIAIQEEVLTLHRQKQRLAITEEDYQKRLAAFGEQMKELEEQRKQDRTAENRYAAMRLWLDEFKEHAESGDFMNDADGSIMKALVEKIIVKDASMEICFKCGVSIEQVYIE